MAVEEKTKTHEGIRYRIYPDIDIHTDYDSRTIDIEIALPGVEKKDIDLKMLPTWFHIRAVRGEIEYAASYTFGVEVVPEKTSAKYEHGLLRVRAVIRNPMDEAKSIDF